MKTMTCQQLGGACDLQLAGETRRRGDQEPGQAPPRGGRGPATPRTSRPTTMKGRWRHPIKGMGWYKDTKRAFAALPVD